MNVESDRRNRGTDKRKRGREIRKGGKQKDVKWER